MAQNSSITTKDNSAHEEYAVLARISQDLDELERRRNHNEDAMLTEEEKTRTALENYERFFKLTPGTATVKKVKASYAGIEGWWRWN